MLSTTDKELLFDDLLEQNQDLLRSYNEQVREIADLSKAIYQAKASLDAASLALLPFID